MAKLPVIALTLLSVVAGNTPPAAYAQQQPPIIIVPTTTPVAPTAPRPVASLHDACQPFTQAGPRGDDGPFFLAAGTDPQSPGVQFWWCPWVAMGAGK